MKKFVLKVVGFGTIVILVFGSWSGMLFYLEVTSYARESKMPGGTVVAVCGDSQTELGLQPRIGRIFSIFRSRLFSSTRLSSRHWISSIAIPRCFRRS